MTVDQKAFNKAAYKAACEARTHYRGYTSVDKYSIAGEDAAFIDAYMRYGSPNYYQQAKELALEVHQLKKKLNPSLQEGYYLPKDDPAHPFTSGLIALLRGIKLCENYRAGEEIKQTDAEVIASKISRQHEAEQQKIQTMPVSIHSEKDVNKPDTLIELLDDIVTEMTFHHWKKADPCDGTIAGRRRLVFDRTQRMLAEMRQCDNHIKNAHYHAQSEILGNKPVSVTHLAKLLHGWDASNTFTWEAGIGRGRYFTEAEAILKHIGVKYVD